MILVVAKVIQVQMHGLEIFLNLSQRIALELNHFGVGARAGSYRDRPF